MTAVEPITLTPGEVSAYIASRLPELKQAGRERRGPCPVHHGNDPNFSVNSETGLATCHSQCGRGWDIIGLHMEITGADFKTAKAEVFRIVGRHEPENRRNDSHANGQPKPSKSSGAAGGWQEIARYPYRDRNGSLVYSVVRYRKPDGEKTFRQCRPDGRGGMVWNLDGVKRVPYHLPNLLADTSKPVFLPEGEKDVHTLESWGLMASCNPGGADSSDLYSQWLDYFRGRDIIIPIDNDEPGRRHALEKAEILLGVAASIRIVELPGLPPKGDVTDWRDAGGTFEQFCDIVREASPIDEAGLKELCVRWGLADEKPATKKGDATPGEKSRAGEKPGVAKTASVSSSFRVTDTAVIFRDPNDPDAEPIYICGRLEVASFTCDTQGNEWGRQLKWEDPGGRTHQWAMPMGILAGDGTECRGRLMSEGLPIAPSRRARELLAVYLQTAQPQKHTLCVSRIGWHESVFVLPGTTIGPEGAETVLYQTPFETEHYLNVSGTVEDWRDNVGRFCSGNSRLILAVSCAFAGPALSLAGGESGGIHLVGATSTGKSTALVVGGSVVGGGGQNGFVRTWRATTNGLEAVAELHNDLTLFLDELAQVDPRDAAETAYLLGNGSGKTRMSRNIGARKNLQWNLLFVSAGEITLADHAQTAGKRVKGGAEVRLLNIEADAGAGLGLFENLHGAESADAFARQLKAAAKWFYGVPIRTYLEYLVRNRAAVEKAIRSFQADFFSCHVPAGASGEVFRAAQRFAVIATAGELATDAGITGWSQGEATTAAARCLESWIAGRGTTGAVDAEAAIRQVRAFIEAHGSSRFQAAKARVDGHGEPIPERVINRAGFRVEEEGVVVEYLILPEVFNGEVSKGFNSQMVAKALRDRGYLNTQPPHLTKKRPLPEVGSIRTYAVRPEILEA